MTGSSWNRKVLLLILSVLACATVAVSIGLVYPAPVESPMLGSEWHCHKSAIVTTCRRVSHADPTVHHPHAHPTDARRV